MSEFVKAWNPKSGNQYPHLVPAHYIGHPVLGENYVDHDPKEAGDKKPKQKAGKAAEKGEE
nr:MAG TPA_asm: hypothetical protein [Caudoviricetes sp.]